ncbi:MAG: NAD-dependent epimerase/dehydratase family protein [SAR86 cluster bacterium]|nr:NAD-dependent epimerase/dehydratase family protein [SAR86 cluster bacterium]
MNFLVTGSAGFIGFHLSKKLLEENHNIVGLDNLNNYYDPKLKHQRISLLSDFKNFDFIESDLSLIGQVSGKKKFDAVIHLAAQAGVRIARKKYEDYFQSNIDGFNKAINFCIDNDINKFIYASSSSVYSGEESTPFLEANKLSAPTSIYAATKMCNENIANIYSNLYGLRSIGLRFFTVYGPFGRPDMAYFKFLKNILDGKTVDLINYGEMSRDMTYIDDIVNGIFNAIQHINSLNSSESQIFNLGNDKPIKTIYLLNYLEKIANKKAKINEIFTKNEAKHTHANITKAKNRLNYLPQVDFEKGIEKFFQWYLEFYKL